MGDTNEVGASGPVALYSGKDVAATGAISEPTPYRCIYEVPGVDSIA